jgi:sulfonate transport system substrate-binding protein
MKTLLSLVVRHALRATFAGLLGAALLGGAAFSAPAAAQATQELRVGYQKYGSFIILKARGTLEKRLAEKGVAVKWHEFAFGPPLLEAINVGSIDVGSVGEAPPIFAQAAGADLVYIGNEPPAPTAEAIVVPKDSPLTKVAELKGRKVAVGKGSNANYLLVKLLEDAGLKFSDIEVVYLPPADARAAFESGRIAAWAIWDPFLAAAERQLNARVLADGKGAVANHQFYLASRSYANAHPEVVRILIEELDKIDQWGLKNPGEVAAFLAPLLGIELPVVELAARRLAYGIKPVTPDVIAAQQKIGDKFFELKLIPKAVRVADAAWKPVAEKR